MLNLNITIDQKSGFCFGVVYAIQMAEEILNERGYLHCLGDIVHNDEEIARLKKKGLITINHQELKSLKNEHVLIRAHGEPPSTYEQAILNNITIIDATCPVVLKLQNRIKQSYDKKENILLFGKNGHAEVIGLMGQINNNGMVFQDMEDLENAELPQNITLYTQTTKSKSTFNTIATDLKQKGYNVTAHDTICTQVADRDGELRKFATKFDKVVFVAGKKSTNGMVLYNVCKEINPNTYFVSSTSELNKEWFKENDSIGICGATSTPLWLMENVKEVLEKI
jgi:4-hydroxy-3-methylbut-2-enyl diphosphate reductase